MNNEVTSVNELPKGWLWTTLGDLATFSSGNPAPQGSAYFQDGIYPFVRVQDMGRLGGKVYLHDTKDHLNNEATRNMQLFPKGSVLFTKSGMSTLLNQRALLGRDMYVVSHIGISYPFGEIPSEWVYYWLKTIDFKNLTHATTLPSLQLSRVQAIATPLAPLPEQHRIVAKIEELFTRLDAGVESLKKIKTQLKRYRQAVLKHAFEGKLTEEWRQVHQHELEPASALLERIKQERKKTVKGKYKELPPLDTSNLPDLPDGWVWAHIHDIGENDKNSIVDGPFGSNLKVSDYVEDGEFPVISITNIDEGFQRENLRYITRRKFEEIKRSAVKPGDIIMAKIGSSYGKCGYYPDWMPIGIIPANLLKVTVSKCLNKSFVFYYLKSEAFKRRLESIMKSTAQPAFNVSIFRLLPFPFPSIPEQHRIVAEIERRFSVADQIEKNVDQSLKQAERLRQSILKRAFEGKLISQDSADEPAEKLLERIKRENTLSDIREKSERETGITARKTRGDKRIGKPTATRSLYDVLRSIGRRMTPSELLEISDLSIQDFYEQLSIEISAGRIEEHRPNDTDVFLEVGK